MITGGISDCHLKPAQGAEVFGRSREFFVLTQKLLTIPTMEGHALHCPDKSVEVSRGIPQKVN